ncbi:MAG: helix-turn-helix domain-containing protein [Planctomycetaceae bacterium]|nr:helix-turn-helix domain-containing protein [Planctomycetaceae bacterium]
MECNDGRQIGYEAAVMLLRKMEGRPLPPLPVKIPPLTLVTRQSTDFIAVNDPDIAKAAQFIRDHALTRIQIDDVVRHVVLSRRTLTRKFQEHLGHTPEHEILRVRMEHAQQLLLSTALSIREVGISVGYPSVEYFIMAFRRRFGITPMQYRQKLERFE